MPRELRCPHCGRRFFGDPWVVKPGELYRCLCRHCCTSWELDGRGERIREGADKNAGTHAGVVEPIL